MVRPSNSKREISSEAGDTKGAASSGVIKSERGALEYQSEDDFGLEFTVEAIRVVESSKIT